MILLRRWALAALLSFLPIAGADASQSFANVLDNLFVVGKSSTAVAVIDTRTDRVIGRIELGLIPRRIEISQSLAKLVAADAESRRVVVVELASGQVRSLTFDFIPRRLLITPDGLTLAVVDDDGGAVAIIDLLLLREKARIQGPANVRDMMFAGNGKRAFLAAEGLAGIAVLDVEAGRLAAAIEAAPARALARAPNGREGFADAMDGLLHLDLETSSAQGRARWRQAVSHRRGPLSDGA